MAGKTGSSVKLSGSPSTGAATKTPGKTPGKTGKAKPKHHKKKKHGHNSLHKPKHGKHHKKPGNLQKPGKKPSPGKKPAADADDKPTKPGKVCRPLFFWLSEDIYLLISVTGVRHRWQDPRGGKHPVHW